MNTSTPQESAKIYQFPLRPRGVIADQRKGAAIDSISQDIRNTAIGACWYHEAAVEQSAGSAQPLR